MSFAIAGLVGALILALMLSVIGLWAFLALPAVFVLMVVVIGVIDG